MKRSKRFEKLSQMPINQDGFSYEWEEVGLIAMESSLDPKPSIKIKNGKIVEMDGIESADFDSLDTFTANYGIDIKAAETSMNMDSLEIARMLVDINVSREEVVKICSGCTPAKLIEIVNHLNVVEIMMAQMKMRARKTPANQAHITNLEDNPALIAADAAEGALRGFAELETTCAVARYASFNAIALMLGAQTGRAGALTQCSMEEATELELGMKGFTSYAETLSVYGTETVLIDGGDTSYSKAFLSSAYISRGIKVRFTSGSGSEVLMGDAVGKSALYLEARCLLLTKACGVQGIQNGSINASPLIAALPNGFRAIAAENLIASMLNIEVASGNDTAFTHSDFRRGAKVMMQFMPGTDYISSGFGAIPNFDNVFAGSNQDCNDFDDWYILQRDMKVDGGIKPIKEEDAIKIRNKAGRVMQIVFRNLGLPEITDDEVEAATYAYSHEDMPQRNKAEDMRAAEELMEGNITILDIIKIIHENDFEDVADNLSNFLKQRVIGDYLHTSAFFDENYKVYSAVNDKNDYMGPGTGYRLDDKRWGELKEKYSALKPQDM